MLTNSRRQEDSRSDRHRSADAERVLDRIEREVENEQPGDGPKQRVNHRGLAAHDLDQDVYHEPRTDSGRDRVGERHEDDRQEGRDRDLEVFPVDALDLLHHQEADHDQGRGRRLVGDHRDQRRQEGGHQEQQPGHHRGQARARALADSRGRLDVCRVAADAARAAGDGGRESTMRIFWALGGLPSLSSRPASAPMATIVPIVSKKSASIRVNTSRIADTAPILPKEPSSEKWPSRPKSGTSTSVEGNLGTFSPQPVGLTTLPVASVWPPILTTASMRMARTEVPMIPMRMAPFTFLTSMMMIESRPTTKTNVGQPARKPPTPSSTGTGPTAGRRMIPESTRPMIVMNRPMPTLMAVFRAAGTARNTALRKPVSTRTVMMSPSRTTSPMASGQVIVGSLAMPKVTNAVRPSPVASASGKLATTPISRVITPAARAVVAATIARLGTFPPPRKTPVESAWVPMIRGLSTTM